MIIKIPEFKEFIDSNQAGIVITNPFWLEHLLNLFFQEYLGEVWEEIMDTKINNGKEIERVGYGIINQEFDKKHLKLKGEEGG